MTARNIPLPRPSELSFPHWDHARRHELWAQQCTDCGRWLFPPTALCNNCLSGSLQWRRSSGRGVIDSFTVVHRPPTPAFDVPYVVAVVRLEEGWYMLSNVVECAPEKVDIGHAVEVCFDDVTSEVTLPIFRLVDSDLH